MLGRRRPSIWAKRCRLAQAANPGTGRAPMVPLLGLAPDGVCRASGVTTGAVSSYLAVSPLSPPLPEGDGMLSVALSVGSPRPAVSGHPARRSSDFPLPPASTEAGGSGRPAISRRFNSSLRLTPPPADGVGRRPASGGFLGEASDGCGRGHGYVLVLAGQCRKAGRLPQDAQGLALDLPGPLTRDP